MPNVSAVKFSIQKYQKDMFSFSILIILEGSNLCYPISLKGSKKWETLLNVSTQELRVQRITLEVLTENCGTWNGSFDSCLLQNECCLGETFIDCIFFDLLWTSYWFWKGFYMHVLCLFVNICYNDKQSKEWFFLYSK